MSSRTCLRTTPLWKPAICSSSCTQMSQYLQSNRWGIVLKFFDSGAATRLRLSDRATILTTTPALTRGCMVSHSTPWDPRVPPVLRGLSFV
jgi:hypothetical protein